VNLAGEAVGKTVRKAPTAAAVVNPYESCLLISL